MVHGRKKVHRRRKERPAPQLSLYEVPVSVLVEAPPGCKRSVEKMVHSLVQDTLPECTTDDSFRIAGASVLEGKLKERPQ